MEAEAYLLTGQPVVLHNAMLTWPSSSWTPEFLSRQLSQPLSCKVTPLSVGKALMETECIQESVCLPDFVHWLRGQANGDNPLQKYGRNTFSCYLDYKYMQEIFTTQPELLKAVRWESVGLEGRDGAASTLWLGSEGAYTNCHYDAYGYNLVAQIYGRKRWVLFPPLDTQHLYPTRIPFEESSIFSQVDVKHPDLKLHPKVKLASVHEVILEPGQILYVPRHWWHYVECLEPAISVNTWVELAVDTESRFEEAVTRSLFSSLWCSHITMERQGTDDGNQGTVDIRQEGDHPQEWINPKEEIWDSTRNTLVLGEAFKAMKEDTHCDDVCPRSDTRCDDVCPRSDTRCDDVCPRSDTGCDLITSDTPDCATSNRERNLEIFARHFRGKTVLFPHKGDSKRCVDQNHDTISKPNKGECSNKSTFPLEILKKPDSYLQEDISDMSRENEMPKAQNLKREGVMSDKSAHQPTQNLIDNSAGDHLKRKHSGEVYSDQLCAAKVSNLTQESSERLLGDLCMKYISCQGSKSDSNTVTVDRPTKTCARCHDQECDGQACRSPTATHTQSEVGLTAVTAQPFMTWLSLCKCADQNCDRDISRNVPGSSSMPAQTQEKQSGSRVPNVTSKSDTGETGNLKKTLTFEKFVMCATHPDVIRTIAKVIKSNMTRD